MKGKEVWYNNHHLQKGVYVSQQSKYIPDLPKSNHNFYLENL